MKRIAITGAAGQIVYSLIFRIARGELFGEGVPLELSLIDVPGTESVLKGVVMELEDCRFPLLKKVRIETDAHRGFEGIHYAFLIGAKPRGPGMERKDLLSDNGKIFVGQGQALEKVADRDVKVLVVGNPCNTNCLITMHHAPSIPEQNFFSMALLDQYRACFQLAFKANVSLESVRHVGIWGNHSATQVPDFINAKIGGRPAIDVISDTAWLETEFVKIVQNRGAAVIHARGKSSAGSAAHAALCSMRSLFVPTEKGDCFSIGRLSRGNPYGIKEDLVFAFPCVSSGQGDCSIVEGLITNSFLEEKLEKTQKELIEERDCIYHLLG